MSRRKTQFRGPPPSFYRSGGWGQQGPKRQTQGGTASSANGTASQDGGLGPGQAQAGLNNDIPYFDREGHTRTHEQQDQRRRRRLEDEGVGYSEGGSVLAKFVLIAAVVSFAFSIPTMFDAAVSSGRRKDEN